MRRLLLALALLAGTAVAHETKTAGSVQVTLLTNAEDGLRVGAQTVVTVEFKKKGGGPLAGCRCRVLLYRGTPSARVPPVQDVRLSALEGGTGRVPLKVDAPGSYTLVLDGRPPTFGDFDAFRLRYVLEAE